MDTHMHETPARHQVTRVRREPQRRVTQVVTVERLTPHMLRIGLASPDLIGFDSAAPDDHIKLFVPAIAGDADARDGVCMRDYTPRAFDSAAGKLTIDFALHEAGPATRWAESARPGDELPIGGPRGSAIVTDDFDWYLLIGDETALPAIARRIEELRDGVPVAALIVVDGNADRVPLADRPQLSVQWLARRGAAGDDGSLICEALAARPLPAGEGYVWIAAEAAVARAVRTYVVDTLGHPKGWIKAAGYWSKDMASTHVRIED